VFAVGQQVAEAHRVTDSGYLIQQIQRLADRAITFFSGGHPGILIFSLCQTV
jgi:hypothetical protein